MAEEMKVTPELEAKIKGAKSQGELTQILTEEVVKSVEQKQAAQEPPKPPEVAPPPAPQLLSRKFNIGGQTVEITAPTVDEILAKYEAAVEGYQVGREQAAPKPPAPPQKTPEQIQADRFELESQFRTGKITAKQYLEKSGAIDEYLESKGIKVEDLKQISEERVSKSIETQWQEATLEFGKNFEKSGTPWPGGTTIHRLMLGALMELGLGDKPSASSLQAAYDHLMSEGVDVFELKKADDATAAARAAKEQEPGAEKSEAVTAPSKTGARTETPSPAAAPTPAAKKKSASALFNVSGDGGEREPVKKETTVPEIPKDATPEQIMAMFKEAVIKQGGNPGQIIDETYRQQRVQ